jgi:hypothetical protein
MVPFEWLTAIRPRQTKMNKRADVAWSENPGIDEVVVNGI